MLRFLIGSVTHQKVTEAKVLNPEITPEVLTGKKIVLDVHVKFDSGQLADVEMQKADEGTKNDLIKRMTAYNARQMSSQLKKGEPWGSLKTCYQITILGYTYFKDAGFHHEHILYDKKYNTENTCFQLHTLELPKLKPLLDAPAEQLSDDEICGILIMYGGNPKYRPFIEELGKRRKEVEMALSTLDTMSKDEKEWELNYTRDLDIIDYNSRMANAAIEGHKKGFAQGRKEGLSVGLSQGLAKAKTEDARSFKQLGVSADIIAKATGLSEQEIEKL